MMIGMGSWVQSMGYDTIKDRDILKEDKAAEINALHLQYLYPC